MRIRIGSVTYAMKAREVLRSYGIDASISKDLRTKGAGCVYVLYVPEKNVDAAYDILLKAGFDLPGEKRRDKNE